MPGYTAQTWIDNNATYPLSAARMTTIENAILALKNLTVNVKDWGAIGDGFTDDTAAIQAAISSLPTSGTLTGGIVYFPVGSYLLSSSLLVPSVPGIVLLGPGQTGSWPSSTNARVGDAEILVPANTIGIRINDAGSGAQFAGVRVEKLSFLPVYTKLQSTGVLGATISTSTSHTNAALPSTGTAWIQDQGQWAKITYTGKSGNSLTGVTIVSESTAGQSYTAGGNIFMDATAGVKINRNNTFRFSECSFTGFNNHDQTFTTIDATTLTGGHGLVIDGGTAAGQVGQYGVVENCYFNGCYTGARDHTSSTRWSHCNFDISMNGPPSVPGSTGLRVTYGQNSSILACNVEGADIGIDYSAGNVQRGGPAFTGCRFERWITAGIQFTTTLNASVFGGSFNNTTGGSVGYGISILAGCQNISLYPNKMIAVAQPVNDAGTNTRYILPDGQTKLGGGTSAPASGTYTVGDVIYHSTPVSGGNIGWVCVTAGSPGTWKTFGTIA